MLPEIKKRYQSYKDIYNKVLPILDKDTNFRQRYKLKISKRFVRKFIIFVCFYNI